MFVFRHFSTVECDSEQMFAPPQWSAGVFGRIHPPALIRPFFREPGSAGHTLASHNPQSNICLYDSWHQIKKESLYATPAERKGFRPEREEQALSLRLALLLKDELKVIIAHGESDHTLHVGNIKILNVILALQEIG